MRTGGHWELVKKEDHLQQSSQDVYTSFLIFVHAFPLLASESYRGDEKAKIDLFVITLRRHSFIFGIERCLVGS